MLKTVRHLLELIRFSHTLFALPFAMLAAVMAWRLQTYQHTFERIVQEGIKSGDTPEESTVEALLDFLLNQIAVNFSGKGDPKWHGLSIRWQEIAGILLCMVTARSFAMAFNRLADRNIDATNPRTAGRHLPAGILKVPQVTAFAALCAFGFIASTSLFLPNRLPLLLSIPVLAFLGGYSFTKRFTPLAHFWLGTSLALSPVAAWLAIRGENVLAHPDDLLPALVLGGAVLTWVAGFDIIYACQDYDVDIAAGHYSIPARFGIPGALRLAALCHLATIALLICLPLVYPLFGWIFWLAIAVVAILLVYEHLLVRPDDLSRVNAAFFNVNAVISLGLFMVGSLDLLIHHV
jgi:4-hydroxybenzoate polyprenyltransferase